MAYELLGRRQHARQQLHARRHKGVCGTLCRLVSMCVRYPAHDRLYMPNRLGFKQAAITMCSLAMILIHCAVPCGILAESRSYIADLVESRSYIADLVVSGLQ